jgi:hypothetical protein
MKKLFVFCILLNFNSFKAQNEKLNGNWILDKVIYKNGNPLEINHPFYSKFIEYEFINNKLRIIDNLPYDFNEFDITINNTKILNQFREINYEINEDQLILNDQGDDKIMSFIKREKFIELFNETDMTKLVYNEKEVYIPNKFHQPKFNYILNFDDFIQKNTPTLNNLNLNEGLNFKFILNKDSKIVELEINENISKSLKKELEESILKAEKFYKNETGKDLLISRSYIYKNSFNESENKIERKINKLIKNGNQFFNEINFKNAILAYKEAIELKLNDKDNTKNINFYKVYINLGISYLAENEIDLACESFRKIGNKSNFDIRNYLINFCE